MHRFSCADYSFPLLNRYQALALLNLLEFRYVDIGLFERNAHFQTSSLLTSPEEFTRLVRRDLEAAQLSPADVFLQVGLTPHELSANDPGSPVRSQHRQVFLHALDLCAAIGCRHLTGLPGVGHGYGPDDLQRAAEEAAWRLDRCRQAKVKYAIEPHVGSICPDVASTLHLLLMVPGLSLTLDYGHFISAGQSSGDVHRLLPHASHIHVRGGAPQCLQTSVAENTIDFYTMLECLQSLNFDGLLALEYVWVDWQGCNRSDNLSETLLLRDFLQRIVSSSRMTCFY